MVGMVNRLDEVCVVVFDSKDKKKKKKQRTSRC